MFKFLHHSKFILHEGLGLCSVPGISAPTPTTGVAVRGSFGAAAALRLHVGGHRTGGVFAV